MVLVSNTCNLILISSKVHAYVVAEVLTNLIVPSESDLNTGILHVTTIDSSGIGTVPRNLLTTDQPVLRGLLIPVEVHA